MRTRIALLLLVFTAQAGLAREFHVSVNGNDRNAGTASKPYKTISAAALVAQPGDVITVHAGTYRERVTPPRGGTSDTNRITYQAAPGEKVVITGSEPVKGWERVTNDTWKVTLPNKFFGSFNPYAEEVHGNWFKPMGRVHHRGCVYLGKDWLSEAQTANDVLSLSSQGTLWFGAVDASNTTIWAQFPGVNPNAANVEINVRPTVFTPEKTNLDYITVRGFELCNAASNWASPTSGQQGLVTAYWCKGWIIENNEIHHSRCCGIALGKYGDEWDNKRGKNYDGTIDKAFKEDGWTKEKIGSHIVRNNHIHHCGQTGIVGSLGCVFSRIEGNEIHDINLNSGWGGAEMGGIKFHGAIDTIIKGNHIYRTAGSGGVWLDWMAQGTQVIGNLLHDNKDRDIFTEVNHGPILFANNILLSRNAHWSNSQGVAYVHNLILGALKAGQCYDGRRTPYHKGHSTELAGRHNCPTGDIRWYNNLLGGSFNLNAYDCATLPVASAGNVFAKGATPSKFDKEALLKADFDLGIKLTQEKDGWYLSMKFDSEWTTGQPRKLVTSELLGKAVIPDVPFENPDGSPFKIDTDYFGKKRNEANPTPGPFETPGNGLLTLKVW